ncbi:hypothetical protein HanPI659440_Chr01g0019261 [Helianthus annuus]|nr:hypothetical protein HanPI659440_Chr01g0019261 [Helianthus annuus]
MRRVGGDTIVNDGDGDEKFEANKRTRRNTKGLLLYHDINVLSTRLRLLGVEHLPPGRGRLSDF